MKITYFFFRLTLFSLAAVSCNDSFDLKNPDVDQFVRLLKNGNYSSGVGQELPDFKIVHVEKLVSYLSDTSAVNFFPANPISSKRTDPKILNECILWTIDGIRFGKKYPSLEPTLLNTLTNSRLSNLELLRVTTIYKQWYADYRNNPSETLLKKDLLAGTGLRWD
jgi:hypothetical protein